MNVTRAKSFSRVKALVIFLAVGLLVAGLSAFAQSRNLSAAAAPPEVPAASAPAAAGPSSSAGSASSYDRPAQPARLIIPAIGVDAAVQSVGLSWHGDGTMAVPTNFTDVGWYNGGPLPGMPGSAVIDGHLDGANTPQAVFYRLGSLAVGDLVEVRQKDGTVLRFKVVATRTYDYTAPTTGIFLSDPSKARLNLITCAGDWDKAHKIYNKRVVVFTELVTAG